MRGEFETCAYCGKRYAHLRVHQRRMHPGQPVGRIAPPPAPRSAGRNWVPLLVPEEHYLTMMRQLNELLSV